jgi:uncharacterized protein
VTQHQHQVPGGAAWSCAVRRDDRITLTALGDDANVTMLIYAAADTGERLNVPDTLKAQMSARIVAPMVLMSQRGRALASVAESTVDWHDAITGYSHPVHVEAFGPTSYQADRNAWRRDAHSLLCTELFARGLDERDLHAPVNWFTKVTPAARLAFVAGHTHAGDTVALRAEQDLLLVLATAPHPLNPVWAPAGCDITIEPGDWPAEHPSRGFRAESARALDAALGRLA